MKLFNTIAAVAVIALAPVAPVQAQNVLAQSAYKCTYNGGPSRLDYVTFRDGFKKFNLGESLGPVPHSLDFAQQMSGYHRDQHGKLWTFDQNHNASRFSISSLDKKHEFVCTFS